MLAVGAPLGPFEGRFVELAELVTLNPLVVAGALLTAAAVGAAHALAPGHGKAIAAAYLAGGEGRARDALLLGGAVAAMHTLSVTLLGLALHLLAAGADVLDRAGAWLLLAAGLLVLAVGTGGARRAVRQRHAHQHEHAHADDVHAHDEHGHAHEPGPAHPPQLPAGVDPLSRRGLVLIGLSGGLLPSPSAFLVLSTALFSGRAAFGFALVAAFSLGLAATLALIGVAVVRGRGLTARRASRSPRLAALLAAVPLASALAITAGGAWLTISALTAL